MNKKIDETTNWIKKLNGKNKLYEYIMIEWKYKMNVKTNWMKKQFELKTNWMEKRNWRRKNWMKNEINDKN